MAMLFRPPISQCRSYSLSVFNHLSGEISSSSRLSLKTSGVEENWVSRFRSKSLSLVFSGALALGLSLIKLMTLFTMKNKPWCENYSSLYLEIVAWLHSEVSFELGELSQHPSEVDDSTTVFVADPTFGNILNFNVGATVDLDIPRSFWSRLAGKYGNMFYWKEKGEDASIEAAVMAILSCSREPVGPNNCAEIK